MAKNYQMNVLENQKYQVIVYMKTLSGPIFTQEMSHIEKDLRDLNIKDTNIIIDRLPHHANSSMRFVEATIENGEFIKSSIKTVKIDKKDTTRVLASEYYREHEHLLHDSLVTNVQKRIILKGYTL